MMVHGALDKIRETLSTWDSIEMKSHRFGGVEFSLGTREIGHMHGDTLVDIPFPRAVRDEIVAAAEAQPHHILPETGWVSFYIRETDDVARAISLLRRSYEIALRQRAKQAGSQGSERSQA